MAVDGPRQGRPGRMSKGERRLINFRLATDKADLAREIATAEGFEHMSDWLAMAVNAYIDKTDLGQAYQQKAPQKTG